MQDRASRRPLFFSSSVWLVLAKGFLDPCPFGIVVLVNTTSSAFRPLSSGVFWRAVILGFAVKRAISSSEGFFSTGSSLTSSSWFSSWTWSAFVTSEATFKDALTCSQPSSKQNNFNVYQFKNQVKWELQTHWEPSRHATWLWMRSRSDWPFRLQIRLPPRCMFAFRVLGSGERISECRSRLKHWHVCMCRPFPVLFVYLPPFQLRANTSFWNKPGFRYTLMNA